MGYLILAVLLAVAQTSSPVSRKASNSPNTTGQNTTKNSGDNKAPTAPSASIIKSAEPNPEQNASKDPKPENAEQSIRVRELPAVTVTAKRDWADWGYWVFGGLLVVVGFLQVWLLGSTLGAIQRQADQMDRQTKKLEESVAVAERAAAAAEKGAEAANKNIEMYISKERARLKIELKPLDLSKKLDVAYTIDFTVDNYGTSPANVIETGCVTYTLPLQFVGDPNVGDAVIFPMHSIPSIIPPDNPPSEQYAFLFIQGAELNEVASDRMFVGIRGFIKYRDTFDRERETRFRHVWKYHAFMPTPTGTARWGNWEKCGSEEENKET